METFPRGTQLDPWFVSGFSDGQASFTYSRASAQKIELYYAIKVTRSDGAILDSISEFFGGIGSLYDVKARTPRANSGHTKSARYFRVNRRDELPIIVGHFDAYPLKTAQKIIGYSIWREMVMLKQQYRKVNLEKLNELAQELTRVSVRRQRESHVA